MSLARKLANNFVLYLAAELLEKGLSLLLVLAFARFVPVEEFGVYSFAIAVGLLLSALSDLGLTNSVLRDLAVSGRNKRLYWRYFMPARFLLAFIVFFAFAVCVPFLPVGTYMVALWILALVALVESLKIFVSSFYRAADEATPIVYAKFWGAIVLIVILALIYVFPGFVRGHELEVLALILLASNTVGLLLLLNASRLGWSKQKLPLLAEWHLPTWKYLYGALTHSVFFLMTTFSYTLILRSNVIILTLFGTTKDTGLFNAAYTIVSAFFILASLFSYVFYTTIAQSVTSRRNEQNLAFITKYVLLGVLPIFAGLAIAHDGIMRFAFADQYAVASPILVILGILLPFVFLNTMLQIMLVSRKLEKKMAVIIVSGALFATALSIILIPRFMIVGAAISTVLSEMFIFFFTLYVLKKAHVQMYFDTRTVQLILVTTICIAILYFIPVFWYVKILLLVPLYIIFVLVMGVTTQKDKEMFKEIAVFAPIIKKIEGTWLERFLFQ